MDFQQNNTYGVRDVGKISWLETLKYGNNAIDILFVQIIIIISNFIGFCTGIHIWLNKNNLYL
jgi:hypothetical protein